MNKKLFSLVILASLMFFAFTVTLTIADELIGTYKISYIYNSMHGGGASGPHNPEGVQWYCDISTTPVGPISPGPGEYYLKFVSGDENGNPGCPGNDYLENFWVSLVLFNNPSATYPDTGYDGGNTCPTCPGQGTLWWYATSIWIGTSTSASDGTWNAVGGLGATYGFTIVEGQKIWLYWHDWWIEDNLGGVTVEIWKKALIVDIDIKPGSFPNCFNSNEHGAIPVAILGSADFDVTIIDPFTVKLDGQAVRVKGKSGNAGSLEDVNGDGFLDLVVQIQDEDSYSVGDTIGIITAQSYDGIYFQGQDSICITQ